MPPSSEYISAMHASFFLDNTFNFGFYVIRILTQCVCFAFFFSAIRIYLEILFLDGWVKKYPLVSESE